jgi:hypothetical protein
MFRRMAKSGSVGLAFACLLIGNGAGVRADTLDTQVSDQLNFVANATITSDSDGDTPASVDLMGGSGTYTANSGMFCELLSDGDTTMAQPCTITVNGSYTSIICGTSTAITGTATVTSAAETATATFAIVAAGGIGVVTGIWNSTGPDDSGVVDAELFTGNVILTAGPSVALPDDTGDCVHTLTILGSVTVRELGGINT